MADKTQPAPGSCLCGAVRYEVRGPLADVHVCHCGQCRRQSGHCVAGTGAKRADFVLVEERGLTWYRSSDWARRGFCAECGSALFWDDDGEEISISAGSLDQPTGLKVTKHIYVDEKGDYYEIADDLPKFEGHDTPVASD
ncbi:MAG: GFA family protein [Hyphomicrobiales bacterium]